MDGLIRVAHRLARYGARFGGVLIIGAAVVISVEVVIRKFFNMTIGGAGLISFIFIQDPTYLIISMIGVGIAWGSILSLPYALLSSNLPAHKMGVYMGIFNFFIVIPQRVAASVLGLIVRDYFNEQSIYGLIIGGALMIIAGWSTLLVDKEAEPA